MKKILNFMADHRFIIGIQAVLSIILVVSIALVNILPMRFFNSDRGIPCNSYVTYVFIRET